MYTVRVPSSRLPQAYHVCKAAAPATTSTRNMSFFPRFVQHDFATIFRLVDALDVLAAPRNGSSGATQSLRTFQPRFDVKEHSDSYELQGELPGIESRDVQIEWTDSNVLSIKGRTESVREESSQPAPAAEAIESGVQTPRSTESDSSYHKASVEDEETASSATAEAPQPTTSQQTQVAEAEKPAEDSSRWWVSERSIGEFARSFSFPSRVDQENVKASMDKGILRILVPKAQAPASRRVEIQ